MNFRQYIYESLGSSLSEKNAVPYKILRKTSKILKASFEVEGEPYTFIFKSFGKDDFGGAKNVSFGEVSFMHADKGNVATGTGNVSQVFSTVFKLIKKTVKEIGSDVIFFDSSGGKGRRKLYSRFAKQVGDLLPGYDGGELDPGEFAIYRKWVEEKCNEDE